MTIPASYISLLSKGLSFIPTPKKLDIHELLEDAKRFITSVRNRYILRDKPKGIQSKFVRKTKLHSRTCYHARLDGTLDHLLESLEALGDTYTQNSKDNLTRAERRAIAELRNNADLIINKADKGSTVVIRDRADYTEKANIDLSNRDVYCPLRYNVTDELAQGIKDRLDSLYRAGLLNEEMRKYCTPPDRNSVSKLYYLTKIHKNPHKERPIVASCNSITENISQFVDHWLQPIMQTLPSFVRDTTDFINLIEKTRLNSEVVLASIDVSSLYTNIPHREGIEACVQALKHQPNPDPLRPAPEVIGELIGLVLKNNVFEFDEKYFLQIQGTAMGTKLAPAYANIFMSVIETQLLTMAGNNAILWKRFIDDIFVAWKGSISEFEEFAAAINTIHDTIKFTHEVSETEVVFLDLTLYKGQRFANSGILDVKTHIKPTNKQLYVHATSYHPPSVKTAIAKGETTRYLRTNSDETNFNKMTSNLSKKLVERGYKAKEVQKQIQEVPFKNRKHALKRRMKSGDTPLIFSTRYTDSVRLVKQIVLEHFELIQQIPGLRRVFPNKPMFAFKKNKNLRDLIVRAKLTPIEAPTEPESTIDSDPQTEQRVIAQTREKPRSYPWNLFDHQQRVKKCKQRGCPLCPKLLTCGFATSTAHKRKFQVLPGTTPMNCKSKRVVYLIQCNKRGCKMQYVGQTMRELRVRIAGHHNPAYPQLVTKHFMGNPHHFSDLTVLPLEKISDAVNSFEAERLLQAAESLWIERLHTIIPRGLNVVLRETHSRIARASQSSN